MTSSTKQSRPGRRAPIDRERLMRKRFEAGLTQMELAEAAGTTAQQISRIEIGKAGVSARLLHRIAGALGCPVADLMPAEQGEAKPE